MNLWRDLKPAVLSVAPTAMAILTLLAGVMLLASGATPEEPQRLRWLAEWTPLSLIEFSHFASSILGLVLVLLSVGLKQRLDAAWAAASSLLLAAAVLALLKGFNWEETAVLALVCAALFLLHEAFPRTARLSRMEITPGWMASAFAAVVGTGILGLWSFHNVTYRDELWWRVMVDAQAGRALRAWAGVGILFLTIGLWRLFSTAATPQVMQDEDPDFGKVRAVLAQAEMAYPEANLALLGDKRFLFSESGQTFLMFGVRGRSWVAMGPPVGLIAERQDLMWRFREMADAHAARPAFYAFGPDLLPEIVEMGFCVQKAGEAAMVDLAAFSLQGRRRGVLRRSWRKACESGAQFEVIEPAKVTARIAELKAVSDAWLADHSGGEKGFSLGRFDPAYVCEFPCAVVTMDEVVVAFATLWPTPDNRVFSIDLMRYGPGAPKDVMDYLFVELLQWGLAQGYRTFEFGMAPLAGLETRPLAPLLSHVGRLVFERGEDIYNFQGVRRYKDKYDPTWEPRYIAAAHKWAIPVALADAGLLSSGGVSGLTKRPRRPPAAAAEPAVA